MAKRKTSRKKPLPKFPPDIFWISPEGKVRDVIGHVTSIQGHPEVYGFHTAPETPEDIDEALNHLFAEGWVRGRFSSGVFSFQMERPRGTPMGNAYDLVCVFQKEVREVEVDFWNPSYKAMAKSMSAKEFLEQRFPVRWGLGRAEPFDGTL
jgi:hypothetical protein